MSFYNSASLYGGWDTEADPPKVTDMDPDFVTWFENYRINRGIPAGDANAAFNQAYAIDTLLATGEPGAARAIMKDITLRSDLTDKQKRQFKQFIQAIRRHVHVGDSTYNREMKKQARAGKRKLAEANRNRLIDPSYGWWRSDPYVEDGSLTGTYRNLWMKVPSQTPKPRKPRNYLQWDSGEIVPVVPAAKKRALEPALTTTTTTTGNGWF